MVTTGQSSAMRRAGSFLSLLAFEVAAVTLLTRLGSIPELRIPWHSLSPWLVASPVEDVLAAVLRTIALLIAWWLLATNILYLLASLSRVPGAIRAVRWLTLPVVRRATDHVLALTLATSLMGAGTGTALAGATSAVAMAPQRAGTATGHHPRAGVGVAGIAGSGVAGGPFTYSPRPAGAPTAEATAKPEAAARAAPDAPYLPRAAGPAADRPEATAQPGSPSAAGPAYVPRAAGTVPAAQPAQAGTTAPPSSTGPATTTAPSEAGVTTTGEAGTTTTSGAAGPATSSGPVTTSPAPTTAAPTTATSSASAGRAAPTTGIAGYVPRPAGPPSTTATTRQPRSTRPPATTAPPESTTPTTTGPPGAGNRGPVPTPVPPQAPRPPSTPGQQPARSHRVIQGDNLWTVARDHLAATTNRRSSELSDHEIATYWLRLIAVNRSSLRSGNPDVIFPGELVMLPPVAGGS